MKILIVGLGSIARKHVSAIRKIEPEAEIFALRSKRDAEHMYGVANIYDVEEIRNDLDFILISNPTSCHAQTIETFMKSGIPLFIEKPVFDKVIYNDLVRNVNARGIKTYVACNLRFLDGLMYLKKYLNEHPSRRVNEVNVYCGSYLPDWRSDTDYKKCYSAIPELGGGVHLDLIHDIDYVYWLFGKPIQTRGICRNVSSLEIRSIDYANYSLIYPEFVASVVLNYYRRDYKRTLEIVFEDGTWTLDIRGNNIKDETGRTVFECSKSILDTYEAQMRYFLDLLKSDEKKYENDISTAYEVLNICMNYE